MKRNEDAIVKLVLEQLLIDVECAAILEQQHAAAAAEEEPRKFGVLIRFNNSLRVSVINLILCSSLLIMIV